MIQQDISEFNNFCDLLVKENVHSYLEIGSYMGGSLLHVSKYLPHGSRIVSIDKQKPKTRHVTAVISGLRQKGFDAHQIIGDSANAKTIAQAKALGPYDALFIDGNHTAAYVKSDWENYGPLARIVGFHDIALDKPPCGASAYWNSIKNNYRFVEFISEETRRLANGAFGIGVILAKDHPL